MIEYTENLPETLYLVTRERVRSGDGIRAIKTKHVKADDWLYTTREGVRVAWGVKMGRTLCLLSELYADGKEARAEMEKIAAQEFVLERDRYKAITDKLKASLSKKA